MPIHELIITDVTNYGATLFCVAGWDRLSNQMIRPEPPNSNANWAASRFWDAGYVGAGKVFAVGNIVKLSASPPPENFPFCRSAEF